MEDCNDVPARDEMVGAPQGAFGSKGALRLAGAEPQYW